MGTHPTLPSQTPTGPLADVIKSNNNLIGDKVVHAFPDSKSGSLPFLFKVLSIGTALSIQAHPDKKLAERLFEERPDVYKGESLCWGGHGWHGSSGRRVDEDRRTDLCAVCSSPS